MKGWSAELKRLEAAQKRGEREAKQRQRELERRLKEEAKLSEIERAELEVEQYETEIEVLLSVHKERSVPVDWIGFTTALLPHPPRGTGRHQFGALLDEKISWARSQTGGDRSAWRAACQEDQQADATATVDYREEYEERQRLRSMATRVIAGDVHAYDEAIQEFSVIGELSALGTSISLNFHGPRLADCELVVKGQDVIPSDVKTLTASKKLSVKSMPKARFHEIYQDYICGCILRLARELFALLPLDVVLVTASTPSLSEKAVPVLSVALPRQTLESLDFARLDPSDTIEGFSHRGDAKASKKSGEFTVITPLTPVEVVPKAAKSRDLQELLLQVRNLRTEFSATSQTLIVAQPGEETEPPLLKDS